MDEFGVLTEGYGLKPQGKSAPMSASKLNVSSSSSSSASNPSWGFPSNPSHAPSIDDSFVFARSSGGGSRTIGYGSNGQRSVNLDDFGDIFGGGMYNSSDKLSSNGWKDGGVDYDGLFGSGSARGSGSGAHVGQDDIFGGISGLTSLSSHKSSAAAVDDDDIFGGFKSKPSDRQNDIFDSFVPPPMRQSSHVHDLLGGFGSGNGSGFSSSNNVGSSKISLNNVGLGDDLIPGFGGSNNASTGSRDKRLPEQFDSEDPFVILESTSKPVHISADPLEEFDQFTEYKIAKHKVPNANSPKVSSIDDELEEFAKGKPQKHAGGPEILFGGKKAMSGTNAMGNKPGAGVMSLNKEKAGDDLESFSMKSQASCAPTLRPKNVMNSHNIPKMPQKPARGIKTSMKKASSAINMFGDLSEMFGSNEYTTGSLGDFEEVEGETEERRIARRRRYERTQERVGKAVAEMNQRDYQTQQERQERHTIAKKIDLEIKQWVAGKEGNMRALLSSLQNVLWRECGWEAVSLTDLITSSSVKKVHRKAALCVHPDKVQQKGATIEQKYTAEKVFDILQEAWKKFEADELR